MEAVGTPPTILPGCCFGCIMHSLPVSLEDEPLPVSHPLFVTELPSSFQFTKSFTVSSHTPQKPPTVPRPLFTAEPGPLLLFPDAANSLPEEPSTMPLPLFATVLHNAHIFDVKVVTLLKA